MSRVYFAPSLPPFFTYRSWSPPTPKWRSRSFLASVGVILVFVMSSDTKTKSLPAPCILKKGSVLGMRSGLEHGLRSALARDGRGGVLLRHKVLRNLFAAHEVVEGLAV